MDSVPVLAAAGVAASALLAVSAERRLALTTGTLAALLLLPLAGAPLSASASWSAGAVAYFAATLLGGWLLWATMRRSGPGLSPAGTGLAAMWVVAVGLALVLGILAWPWAIEWLEADRVTEARSAGLLDPSRWALGGGAALAVAAGRLLSSRDAGRLSAGAGAAAGAAWLLALGVGATGPDLVLPAAGSVLPIAAAAALGRNSDPITA